MMTPEHDHKPHTNCGIWKFLAVSAISILLGLLFSGGIGFFQFATLEARLRVLEQTVGVNSERLKQLEDTNRRQDEAIDLLRSKEAERSQAEKERK
jgi:hypothetical protein